MVNEVSYFLHIELRTIVLENKFFLPKLNRSYKVRIYVSRCIPRILQEFPDPPCAHMRTV